MTTLDDILGNNATGTTEPKTETKPEQKAEQKPAPVATNETATEGGEDTSTSFVEEYKKTNPYTPPTEEQLKKEAKKQKRDKIFAAIGDGISALSNLYFTTKGAPSMYDGKDTMSEKTRIRYDRLKKERDERASAYYNGLMKARAADAAVAKEKQADREWKRKLGLDAEARKKREEDVSYRKERDAIEDARADAKQKYREDKDKKDAEQRQKNADRNYNLRVKQHDDNTEIRREQSKATAARGVRGKRIGFSDGKGNDVGIFENVWKGSMQGVFDTLREELLAGESDALVRSRYDTPQKKEDFVKQNWWRSAAARAQMRALSGLDPSTMTSDDNDEIEDYVPGGSDDGESDEITDYVPEKK